MDKNIALKTVNPVLAVLLLNQPFSALLMLAADWDIFEGLHVGGRILLLLTSVVHLLLNWRWVQANFLRKITTRLRSTQLPGN